MSHSNELGQSGQCVHDMVSLSDRSRGLIKQRCHRRKQDLNRFKMVHRWCAKQFQRMCSNMRIVIRISNFVNHFKTDHSQTETWKILNNPQCFSPSHGGHLFPSHIALPNVAKCGWIMLQNSTLGLTVSHSGHVGS